MKSLRKGEPRTSQSDPCDSAGGAKGAVTPLGFATLSLLHADLNEDLWWHIERHLLMAYVTLRDGAEKEQQPLKAPKHRMEWYAIIYNACNGDPTRSRELYKALALIVLDVLEVLVLYSMLQNADRSRLRITKVVDKDAVTQSHINSSCVQRTGMGFTGASVVSADTGRVVVNEEALVLESSSVACPKATSAGGAAPDDNEGYALAHALQRPHAPHFQLCEAFNKEYATFKVFQRVVITSFRYLDQYYTRRYGMDPIHSMCTRLFYVVVYEPLKSWLVGELLGKLHYVREEWNRTGTYVPDLHTAMQTLDLVIELLVAVCVTPSYLVASNQDCSNAPAKALSSAASASTLPATSSDRERRHRRLLHFITGDSYKDVHTEFPTRTGDTPGAGQDRVDAPIVVDMQGVLAVRHRLECTTTLLSLADQSMQHARRKQQAQERNRFDDWETNTDNSESSGDDGHPATLKQQVTGTIIKEITTSLQVLAMGDFGDAYVAQMEKFYRGEREQRLLTASGRRGYIAWCTGVYQLECLLVKNPTLGFLKKTVQATLARVLTVEVHRQVILDAECGFLSLLVRWEGDAREEDNGLAQTTPGLPAKPAVDSSPARALCAFFNVFTIVEDESCLLLLASVFASKLIRDCAAHLRVYLQAVTTRAPRLPSDGATHDERRMEGGGPSADVVAGDVLIDALLRLTLQYTRLIQQQFCGHAVLQCAQYDALTEVLNPVHWSRGDSVAVSELRVRSRALLGSSVGSPSVLLSKDAGAKATAALNDLAAALPSAATFNLPLLFANYCDRVIIRRLMEGRADAAAQTRELLTQLFTLAALLEQKDMFLEYHRARLAKRLLRTAPLPDMDVEKMVVLQMKLKLNICSTQAIENMLRDYESAMVLRTRFEQTELFHRLRTPTHVQLLSLSRWPTFHTLTLTPHVSLRTGMEAFQQYYASLHPLRTLNWVHRLGTACLEAEYPAFAGGRKEVVASTVQATLLLLVSEACNAPRAAVDGQGGGDKDDDVPCIRGEELARRMGMTFRELQPHVGSVLLRPPFALLARLPSAEKGEADKATQAPALSPLPMPTDRFLLNRAYTHRLRKVYLPMPQQCWNATPGDDGRAITAMGLCGAAGMVGGELSNPEAIHFSGAGLANANDTTLLRALLCTRKQQLDVAMVRIMKSHRLLDFHNLVDLTVQQVSRFFVPTSRDLKTQLEDLIHRGYIKRSDTDHSRFEYIT